MNYKGVTKQMERVWGVKTTVILAIYYLLILLLYRLESWKALLKKMYYYCYYLRSYRNTWGVEPPRAGGLAPADPRDNTYDLKSALLEQLTPH